jgi:glycosyltransferase involved in cell wall biosynthesis
MNYSFFYTKGGAGHIRGIQMAQQLGGKQNPTSGFENDICIYVKIMPPENYPKHTYYDIVDAFDKREYVTKHPELKIIVAGDLQYEYLSKMLHRDDLITIPVPHCNDERFIRPDREVKTVGILGGKFAFTYPIEDLRKRLADIGLELIWHKHYWRHFNNWPTEEGKDSREKVCRFYKRMDINLAWRPQGVFAPFKTPLKLANAGAFGIPTVSYPEDNYVKEWNGFFIPVHNIDEIIAEIKKLKEDKVYYADWSKKALERAEPYHVDHILEMYRRLV